MAAAAAAAAGGGFVGERRKLFVGGIPTSAQEAELRGHFGQYGAVRSVIVMRDKETGHGRGFGFVEFEEEEDAARALGDGEHPRHLICGRVVDVKRARARPQRNHDDQSSQHQHFGQGQDQDQGHQPAPVSGTEDGGDGMNYASKKVFIGGLRDNITEEEFKTYFESFGTVTDVVVIYDSMTNRSRGFGFVTFDSEEAVRKVIEHSFHDLKGTRVEAKIAIPKDASYYRNGRGRGSRNFGGRGYAGFDGPSYQPYNDRYGFYNSYNMPQPVPPHPYYPGVYYGMGGGYPYVNAYSNMGAPANIPPGMMTRRPVYGAYPPMFPGYGVLYRGYAGAAPSIQHDSNGGSDSKKDQTSVDVQEVDSAASVATKLEFMKLGSQ
uniref:RRM domain-containing protein n=1 Tax=Oryza meridionalis TaxID=40149 RepID=A0A0E0E751_9ORYZ